MLERAFTAGVPCAWVAGDSSHGADSRLRHVIGAWQRGYVLAATSGQRLSAGDGPKRPRTRLGGHAGTARGWRTRMLVRRRISKPADLTYCLTHAAETITLA
ncbi:hypothetical protein GCM10011504_20220 [Siccirubricoccus deserti]|uniref:Transposase n=1 Tax=Siccirubricoccus deserti TaxID=2013562 RepID=A0A9X0UGN6_9PROT|nr:hypothetical protein [Siccirubricoccus deserti]MBC4015445.1 hypothetical protein [Siccirubricoccus deserti]GGC41744.1 hypothetical protein GCM10011504_20220 [Siccirubricoccus deserti]